MASCTKFDFLSGLTALGRRRGLEIEGYADYMTDTWTIRGREPSGNWTQMKISRYEVEDNEHIAKLQDFMEMLMCATKGSTPVTQPSDLAKYQQLVQQQPADWNGYQRAINNNLYKGEYAPNPVSQVTGPKIAMREPTVEDFKKRMERKLDLSDDRGDDDGKRTPKEDSNGGRKRRDGTGGSDVG